jgi:UDP-GlcNAc3NAcA epimerase
VVLVSSTISIVTIVGARPQFIKAAVVSRLIRRDYSEAISEYLVHTGQHYDSNMSEVFFSELDIPAPDVNLEVGSGSHGRMTGEMLWRIEELLLERRPDYVLIYGDTNSTMAGALAASKLNIPVAHVEAGLRSYDMRMPEEQNRIVADHVSSILFAPTSVAVSNLRSEGISKGVELVGDVMYDAALHYANKVNRRSRSDTLSERLGIDGEFFLLTLHRAENTDDGHRLRSILGAFNDPGSTPCIFPVHPRTTAAIKRHGLSIPASVRPIEPIGYLDMIELEQHAKFIVTDSGGVQKEAYFHKRPCITLRESTEWVETVDAGANILVGADEASIRAAVASPPQPTQWESPYGDGDAGRAILEILAR